MNYRVTCLTPLLVGDGQKLAPIDYMVWKDHVNVLDQRRIFRLLAKGPRLEGYLAQLKKVERLDFASWGGFAQNFAGRRIPFEHPSAVAASEKALAMHLFIPTFASAMGLPYLPATAVKGALRTGSVFDRWNDGTLREVAGRMEERAMRNPAQRAEESVLGGSNSRLRRVALGDSTSVPYAGFKIFLLRASTLVPRGAGKFELGWKSMRGSVDSRKIDESTPVFAEMAAPGTAFEGIWQEKSLGDRHKLFSSSNRYAASQLARHKQYAEVSGLARLKASLEALESQLQEVSARNDACLLSLGWGGGLLSKVAVENTEAPQYREILKKYAIFEKALQTGLPFPKTRRIVFEGGYPAHLPGWVLLEVV